MCFNKAEEDELRVKEALLKERAVEREMQALQAQQRLEMQVAADKLGSEYAKQTEALHREQAAARAAAQADHQRELEAQARRFEQEIALVQDQVAAERAAVDGELAQTRVQCDQLLTAERGWAERHATLEERVATMEGEHAAAVRALDAERQASMAQVSSVPPMHVPNSDDPCLISPDTKMTSLVSSSSIWATWPN